MKQSTSTSPQGRYSALEKFPNWDSATPYSENHRGRRRLREDEIAPLLAEENAHWTLSHSLPLSYKKPSFIPVHWGITENRYAAHDPNANDPSSNHSSTPDPKTCWHNKQLQRKCFWESTVARKIQVASPQNQLTFSWQQRPTKPPLVVESDSSKVVGVINDVCEDLLELSLIVFEIARLIENPWSSI